MVRRMEPGTLADLIGCPFLQSELYGNLVLAGKRSGYAIIRVGCAALIGRPRRPHEGGGSCEGGIAAGRPSEDWTSRHACSSASVVTLLRLRRSSRRRVHSGAPLFTRYAWGGAGVRPWRRMISAIFARSGGPPGVALITSAASRKNCGPIAAGVITHSAFASGSHCCRTGERRRAECRVPALAQRRFVFRQLSSSTLRRDRRSSLRNGRGYAPVRSGAVHSGP